MKKIILTIIILLLSISCNRSIKLDKYTKITINNSIELNKEDIIILQNMMQNLKPKKYQVLDVPDINMYCFNNENLDLITAFYIKEGIIYFGSYVDAFTDRMHDNYSNCYIMTEDIKQYLNKIIIKYKIQKLTEI